jgi:hypothetical protein
VNNTAIDIPHYTTRHIKSYDNWRKKMETSSYGHYENQFWWSWGKPVLVAMREASSDGHEGEPVLMTMKRTQFWWAWRELVLMVMREPSSDGHKGNQFWWSWGKPVIMVTMKTNSDGHKENQFWWSWRKTSSDSHYGNQF